jgi:hypothetical protein
MVVKVTLWCALIAFHDPRPARRGTAHQHLPRPPTFVEEDFQTASADGRAGAGVTACWCSHPSAVRSQRCVNHAGPARSGAVRPNLPRIHEEDEWTNPRFFWNEICRV